MKIALLAYSSNTGLGYQTRDFYKHMHPEKVLIADLSSLNNMPVDHSWCKSDHRISNGLPSREDCIWLLEGVDLLFVCETPLNYQLFEIAREKRVKIVHQFNPEFLDYFYKSYLPKPHILANPSTWMTQKAASLQIAPVDYWPVPINLPESYYVKTKLDTFIHIIGRPAAHDRNGSLSFLSAAMELGKKYKYKVYLQNPSEGRAIQHFEETKQMLYKANDVLGNNLEIIFDVEDNNEMYKNGECLVLPRRYGGLCLPMCEALGHAIPVIMTKISPNTQLLPDQWLVNSYAFSSFKAKTDITIYSADIKDLVDKMNYMAENIEFYSKHARKIAEGLSWQEQAPIYRQKFEKLLKSK